MYKKQKIGIMTLSASDNCGSLLQTYALKRLIEQYGDVEVINFSTENSHKIYDIPLLSWKRRLYMAFVHSYNEKFNNLYRCKKAYKDFRIKQLQMDEAEIFPDELVNIKDKYNIVVAGSDQVWNVEMGDFDESFFCGWTNARKIAYAPSLGGKDIRSSKNAKQITEWIKMFEFLSAREKFGKECLEEVSGRKVERVLDPTLVLHQKEWKQLVGQPLVKGDYIFYYSWAYCYDDQLDIVKKESKRLGMPVFVIDSRKWLYRDEKRYDFILSKNEGPLSFLNLMFYAKHVYVESFHGVVFAYIFKKNFWLLDSNKDLKQMDRRLIEIIDILNAQGRILTPYNYNVVDIDVKMRYFDNSILNGLRDASEKYIEKAFGV